MVGSSSFCLSKINQLYSVIDIYTKLNTTKQDYSSYKKVVSYCYKQQLRNTMTAAQTNSIATKMTTKSE